ncbi:hypothetical protein BU24DRAFT_466084 [Aaosphaeria arxii CBS 175.79]|uniref:CENP-V/GFA domain-containing protein n=1 Tax=Aaosphaeria arxii CBS 175.79 TaxID=1450172 RepID=A0A6A5XET8_9PLEO|nr:uncharacterized protein BU24DRAFT_466084 [Aaosphaeria arxii CBS 175.79]KAF2011371.1 hypothetical protein BU24DRAFT_466084 [Aaosphaeria arxii CBS 175.79]
MSNEGRCNCGSIKVKLPDPAPSPILCYCFNCRRASAGICSANYMVPWADVTVSDPNKALKTYKDSDTISGNTITRHFCGTCGCPIYSLTSPDSPMVILKGGLFEHTPAPIHEVFTQDKVPWASFQIQEKKENL